MTDSSLPMQIAESDSRGADLTSQRLSDLTGAQWKSGLAAWLGWLFDGLDMHLYTVVATPFVAMLLHVSQSDPQVKLKTSWIQAAFLVGWALGGGFFGRVGDRLGRSKALGLTILTYATFTGLSSFAQSWQQLLVFRFMAALGIGGEWAVGSALLAETWPRRWRPWAAACLQTAVNIGVLIALVITYLMAGRPRWVFLVGIVPALIVFWIRKSVPEPAEWLAAQANEARMEVNQRVKPPGILDLFRGSVRPITLRTLLVCACSLTSWWGFMFWINQHFRFLPDVAEWKPKDVDRLVSVGFFLVIGTSIAGNFFAGALARYFGYRRAIAMMFVGFFLAMVGTFYTPRDHVSLLHWVPWVGFFSGVFGLFTMYLPPLFPVLLRTTGAGFSYNLGRLAAAVGTVVFGLFAHIGDFRTALLYNSFLLVPATFVALTMPDVHDGAASPASPQTC